MRVHRRDRFYCKSALGILELLIMLCVFFGMVSALIASTGWAQEADWISYICRGYNTTNLSDATFAECNFNSSWYFFSLLPAATVKKATIAIFASCLIIVLIISLSHLFAGLRKRKNWKMITRIIVLIFLMLFLLIIAISIAAIFWEIKLWTIFGVDYTSNSYQLTPTGYHKAQTGAAGAAGILGFLAAFLLLIDIICRLLTIGSLRKRIRRRKMRVNVIS